MPSLIDTPGIQTLGRYLDLAARRESIVASNIANLDTPGYQTKDVAFGEELNRIMQGEDSHPISAKTVPGLVERPDGNNVSLDREGLLLGQTQLQFNVGVQLLRSEFRRLSVAINEGRNG